MGIKVGMPMLKLKRGAASGKHAGNLRAIAMEAGEERASKTRTLDPSRSELNLHLGPYSKGWEAAQAIEDEVADYEVEYKKTSHLGRGLRNDAAVAVAFIIKPDGEWINSQTKDEQERFFSDSYEVLKELGIVNDEHVRMRERHMDEGAPHEHIIMMAYDKDGKLAGSRVVNLKTFGKLNRDYPKKMQERGWPVDELKAYDHEKVKEMTDEEATAYKAEHIANKEKRHGLSANEYAAMKDAEKANALRHELDNENERLNDEVNEKIGDLEDVQEQVAAAKDELAELKPEIKQAKKYIRDAERQKSDVHEIAMNLREAMGNKYDYRPDAVIIAEAKKWSEGMKEKEDEIARQKAKNARKTLLIDEDMQKVDKLLKDAQEVADAPSGFTQFLIDKVKERYPNFYANCQKAWDAMIVNKKVDLEARRRRLHDFDDIVEANRRLDEERGIER